MSSLGLSEEMLAVKDYLSDARVLVDEQFGRFIGSDNFHSGYAKNVIEVARMLQIERTHRILSSKHQSSGKKPKSEKATEAGAPTTTLAPKRASSDKLMSRVRANPKLPPMISTEQDPEEPAVKRSRSSKRSKSSTEKSRPSRSKSDPKPRKVKDSAKPRRR